MEDFRIVHSRMANQSSILATSLLYLRKGSIEVRYEILMVGVAAVVIVALKNQLDQHMRGIVREELLREFYIILLILLFIASN